MRGNHPIDLAQKTLLVLLCKRPAPGQGKQRLANDTNPNIALKIAGDLLYCALEDLSQWHDEKAIAPASTEDIGWAQALLPHALVNAQTEGNLGERLNALDQRFRALGYRRILYIGSDCPQLSPQDLQEANTALDMHDAVLYPAIDGGVVLMGCRRPWPDLAKLPWSEQTLGSALKSSLQLAQYSVYESGLYQDLDTRSDAIAMLPSLVNDKRESRQCLLQTIVALIKPRLSIIVPCYRDERHLNSLLVQLTSGAIVPYEILVIDAASDEECKKLCDEWQPEFSIRRHASKPCRGKQLLEGAQSASGDVLWFLHADTIIDLKAMQQVILCIQQGVVAGYFQFHFDRQHVENDKRCIATCIEKLTQWRNRWGGIYGDQGIFVTRAAYFTCGGHSAAPLFEEVPLIKALRKNHTLAEIPTGLSVDPRRWQKDGWIIRSLRNRLFALLHMMGVPESTLAKYYSHFRLKRQPDV